ncbi:helix-turn-helix transcriptional regulator [Avibacterium sp. 20-126]|uniref:helix-turn-helix domain-containing protein n=1 Tax=Avibacterium sp. 20-126 TaxID=2911524 RepID=UPI002189D196|nr:helix-turn-helix transcriptional regulator [Avibacterium sp. 20-126]
MNISDRLKQVMDAKNLNIKAFSEASEIPYRSVQNYLREEREPNVDALLKVSRSLNVNINWLLTGEGEMFLSSIGISQQEEELLADYRAMPENLKEAFSISFKQISGKK